MKNVFSISVKSLCFFLVFSLYNLQAQQATNLNTATQSYTVKGIVLEQGNSPLGGVNVVLKGTKEGVVTDFNGEFEFPRQLNIDDVLIFSYIGYNPQEYIVVADASKNEAVEITFDLSDISLLGAVEVEGVYISKQNIFQKFIGLFK